MRLTAATRALIGSRLSQSNAEAEKARALQATLDTLEAEARAGGGPRGHQRHCVVNKKVAPRQRLRMLFDGGQFYEINRIAGHAMSYGTVPAAGSITAIGRVSDRLCIAAANDATVKGGTLYPIGVQKMLRLQELSGLCRIPLVYLVDSGGAFLPLQSEIFPDAQHGGRTFRNEAVLNALGIPQLALVLGSSTAGGAYVPTMCDEVVMVDKIAHVFLGGPPLVQAALGEIVSADDLGGAALHSNVSGCSDHFAEDEDSGFRLMRDIAATLPQPPSSHPLPPASDPLFPTSDLNQLGLNLIKEAGERRSALINIISRLVDASQLLEFKPSYSEALVCGFARICGRTVGIMGSWTRLSEKDAVKGAHFIELCGHRSLPLISLAHTEPDAASAASADGASVEVEAACLRAKARMMALMANFPLPKLTVIVGDAVGCDYYLMGGRSMSPTFLLAWPNARLAEHVEATEPSFDAFKAAGQLWVDDVIRPSETRMHVTSLLQVATHYSNMPTSATRQIARQPGDPYANCWPSYPILRM